MGEDGMNLIGEDIILWWKLVHSTLRISVDDCILFFRRC